MAQLIDKAVLVAEIYDRRDKIKKGIFSIPLSGHERADATLRYEMLGRIKDFLDTLEVKEVDLEKEILNWIGDEETCKDGKWTWYECNNMIRHFFELGLKAQKI